jgi:hypothetical protein
MPPPLKEDSNTLRRGTATYSEPVGDNAVT